MAGLGREVTFEGDPHDLITCTHGEQDLGRRRQQGDDAHARTLPMDTTMLTPDVTPTMIVDDGKRRPGVLPSHEASSQGCDRPPCQARALVVHRLDPGQGYRGSRVARHEEPRDLVEEPRLHRTTPVDRHLDVILVVGYRESGHTGDWREAMRIDPMAPL